ncbi:hypothetical protein BDN70DRAFT_963748 [Pholiota conissans]|uniref:Uncharacterized protein n=1 Tax=Pholiota conissans TaxID=109636 RepID=A0A9P6D4W9_9AGAR|nr:hypothetical protein BDN70DRAFT_963748 [Pholiota conissans]
MIFSIRSLYFLCPDRTNSCKNYELVSTILDLVSIAVIECMLCHLLLYPALEYSKPLLGVLIMRTQALYQHRGVLILLSFLCLASMAVMLTCFLLVFNMETFVPANSIGLRGCLSGCTSPLCQPLLIAFWVPFLVFETLVFVLTAWKSYHSFLATKHTGSTTIIRILARDAVSICNFLIWILDPFASYLAVGLLKSLQVTICSRYVLSTSDTLTNVTDLHLYF